MGYGKNYKVIIKGEEQNIDLSILENKPFNEEDYEPGKNEFNFTLPSTEVKITYKILTGHDEGKIDKEIAGLKRLQKDASPELSTRLKYIITSVDGETGTKEIREYIDNYLLARDSRALREHIKENQPDVDLNYILEDGEEVSIPIGMSFFWPDI